MSNQFQIKHFNWVSRPSGWQQLKINGARIANVNSQFLSRNSAAGNTMYSALINQGSGSATIAAQVALDRVQADAKAKLSATNAKIDQAQSALDKAKAASTGSTVNTTV